MCPFSKNRIESYKRNVIGQRRKGEQVQRTEKQSETTSENGKGESLEGVLDTN